MGGHKGGFNMSKLNLDQVAEKAAADIGRKFMNSPDVVGGRTLNSFIERQRLFMESNRA